MWQYGRNIMPTLAVGTLCLQAYTAATRRVGQAVGCFRDGGWSDYCDCADYYGGYGGGEWGAVSSS